MDVYHSLGALSDAIAYQPFKYHQVATVPLRLDDAQYYSPPLQLWLTCLLLNQPLYTSHLSHQLKGDDVWPKFCHFLYLEKIVVPPN